MEFLKAFFFGVLEGVTEWLPISSTGHLIILNEFVKLDVSENFYNVFEVMIQLGAILAVLLLFIKKLWPFGLERDEKTNKSGLIIKKNIIILWVKIIISCLPAAVVGILFDEVFEAYFYNYFCVALALILFGIAFIVVETVFSGRKFRVNKTRELTYKDALIIGIFQLLAAIFPGTSRSGATIVGALLMGVSRPVAAEYTFCLGIPVMAGASLLKIIKNGFAFTGAEYIILAIGFVTAFVVSLAVIKFLLEYVRKHDFKVFGYYRIVLGFLLLLYFGLLKG